MKENSKLLCLAIVCLGIGSIIIRCNANQYYGCGIYLIRLDSSGRTQIFIYPELQEAEYQETCTWEFMNMHGEPRHVFIEGVYADPESLKSGTNGLTAMLAYKIVQTNAVGCPTQAIIRSSNLTAGAVQLLSLPPRSTFTITMKPQVSQIGMRIVPIDPGYCAMDMSAYGNACYYISPQNLTLIDSMKTIIQSCDSGLQLTNFFTLEDVQDFIKSSSSLPENIFPKKDPINLSRPVRIGVFNSSDGLIFNLARVTGRRTKKLLQNIGNILSAAQMNQVRCGSLRVDESGSPVTNFVNCSLPMPALISFPDTPEKNFCSLDCSDMIEKWLHTHQAFSSVAVPPERSRASVVEQNTRSRTRQQKVFSFSELAFMVIGTSIFTAIVTSVIILIVMVISMAITAPNINTIFVHIVSGIAARNETSIFAFLITGIVMGIFAGITLGIEVGIATGVVSAISISIITGLLMLSVLKMSQYFYRMVRYVGVWLFRRVFVA